MGIGTSLFLLAVGAVLRFAVDVTTNGFNIHNIGVILMVIGAIGILLSLAFWNSWGGMGGYRRETVVDGGPSRRRRVVDEEVV
ncbi:MAG: hypothetical protein H0W70_05950 [Actinobacteria bacterium]|nr:hypothetical protein [Actinomycetota bacterium]